MGFSHSSFPICKSSVFPADFRSTSDYPNRHVTYQNAGRAVYDVFPLPVLALNRSFSLLNAHTQASRALSLGFVLPTSNAIMRRIFRVTSCGQKYVNIQPKLEFTNYFFKIIPHRLIYLVLCQETLYLCIEHYSSLTIGRIL